MSETVFVDTNLLVYVRDRTEAEKQRRAAEWMAALWDSRRGRLSVQVLQEPVVIDSGLLEDGWDFQERFGFSWWDALIVAAAHRSGSRWLLTEDLQNGQDIFGITIVNPFTHTPETILSG